MVERKERLGEVTLQEVLNKEQEYKESKSFILVAESAVEGMRNCCVLVGGIEEVLEKYLQTTKHILNAIEDENHKKAVAMDTMDLIIDTAGIDVKEYLLLKMLR